MEIIKLPKTDNPYIHKDQAKADRANKMIAFGCAGSSTNLYAKANPEVTNTGKYTSADIVFVSVNGARRYALHPSTCSVLLDEIKMAIKAGVKFITDSQYDRNRKYNVGEREVALLLSRNGYMEVGASGFWYKPDIDVEHR